MRIAPAAFRTPVLALLVLASAACVDGATGILTPDVEVPVEADDGWSVASLEAHAIDARTIRDITTRIEAGEFRHVHSLAMAHGGDLVFERYFREHERDSLHTLQSVTKSVGSVLIGIAVDQGVLDLDASLPELLPSRAEAIARDPAKATIRLRDLLSMRAGLAWDEWNCDYRDASCNSNKQMNEADDWVGFVLERPVVDEPGTRFVYNSGVSNLLAAILRDATGEDPAEFAERTLFRPLQIRDYRWYRNTAHPDSLPHFGGGLRLTTRDLAKVGQLYLDGGVWNGRRVVSPQWIEASTTARSQVSPFDSYGYQWWTRPFGDASERTPSPEDVWFGWGFGGQHVFVIPSLELVIAINAWNEDGGTAAFEILEEILGVF